MLFAAITAVDSDHFAELSKRGCIGLIAENHHSFQSLANGHQFSAMVVRYIYTEEKKSG